MARYEKTIAGNDFIFSITIPTTYTTVYNLLTEGQKAIILPYFTNGNVVDGYVVSYQGPWLATRPHDEAGVETVLVNEKYGNPVENWVERVMIRATVATPATVRIFVS